MFLFKYLAMLFTFQEGQTIRNIARNHRQKRALFDLFGDKDFLADNSEEFTEENMDILKDYEMYDINYVIDEAVRPSSQTIKWPQHSICTWQCSKEYLLVDYYRNGNTSLPVMKVFVAREVGLPPASFNTAEGVRVGDGQLHFGYISLSFQGSTLFFVIHPNEWKPFQKTFKTSQLNGWAEHLLSFGLETGVGFAVSTAITAAGGALGFSIAPALGPLGPIIGGSAGVYLANSVLSGSSSYLAGTAFRRSYGKYLNFIGGS